MFETHPVVVAINANNIAMHRSRVAAQATSKASASLLSYCSPNTLASTGGSGGGGPLLRSHRASLPIIAGTTVNAMDKIIGRRAPAARHLGTTKTSATFSTSSEEDNKVDASSSSASSSYGGSSRGREAVRLLPTYLSDARSVDRYHERDCPGGALQLSVAENQMLEDLLVPALRTFSSQEGDDDDDDDGPLTRFTSDLIYYQPTQGRPDLQEAFATYLQRLLRLRHDQTLDPNGIVIGAGCNAVLENLCFTLADAGEAVLTPTPYYAAFEFDLVARAGLRVVPVHTVRPGDYAYDASTEPVPASAYYPTREGLDEAYEEAIALGHHPRILLLCHPNNPLAVCYPPEVLRLCLDWAEERDVHVISDEIYAGSVYGGGDTTNRDDHDDSSSSREEKKSEIDVEDSGGCGPFTSMLTVAAAKNAEKGITTTSQSSSGGMNIGPNVHFVYSLSKDFALSGLRVGVLYTENESIRLPLYKLNDLCSVSSQTQRLVTRMLLAPSDRGGDEGGYFVDDFLKESQRRLRRRSDRVCRLCEDLGVPVLPPDSGLFVWVDLREFLPAGDPQPERTLYLELMREHGLCFTPGESMVSSLPGFFRFVFAAASEREFDLSLKRLEGFVRSKR